jgi:hypothetical protein
MRKSCGTSSAAWAWRMWSPSHGPGRSVRITFPDGFVVGAALAANFVSSKDGGSGL